MVVEIRDPETSGFTFKYSDNEEDYLKCNRNSCGMIGLYDQVKCICNEISYCSEDCKEQDSSHYDNCKEVKRRELDPAFINFVQDDHSRNGICGLNNLGNTCYMNASLQCLSHTEGMAAYFARLMMFKDELNINNKLASKLNQVTIHWAKLVHQLWNVKTPGHSQVFNPNKLK